MFSLLLIAYAEISSHTESYSYSSSFSQNGNNVTAQESTRNKKQTTSDGFTQTWDNLDQKSGKTDGHNTTTRARNANGYTVQPFGQSEQGQLTITNRLNIPTSAAGYKFDPRTPSRTNVKQFSCRDGRCSTITP